MTNAERVVQCLNDPKVAARLFDLSEPNPVRDQILSIIRDPATASRAVSAIMALSGLVIAAGGGYAFGLVAAEAVDLLPLLPPPPKDAEEAA